MASEKKFFFKSPKLSDSNGDLSKRWFVYYYPQKGERVKISEGINQYQTASERYEAAEQIIKELNDKAKEILSTEPERMILTLEDSKAWYEKKTFQTYHSKLKIFSEWWGNKGAIRGQEVKEFFIYLQNEREVVKTTMNSYRQTLHEFYEKTFKGRNNPFEEVAKIKAIKTPALFFSESQIKRLKREIPRRDPQLWLFCQFQYYTFLRPGKELRLLQVGNILLNERKIRVVSEDAKNDKIEYVAIPDRFWPVVEELELDQYSPNHYVFSKSGVPGSHRYGERHMAKKHQAILKDLGFDTRKYKLYSWKHTGAVMAAKAGVPVKMLQIQLRHHSLDQVNQYLRQMGVQDLSVLSEIFPSI